VLAKKAISSGITNPIRANGIIGGAVHNLTVDDQLSDHQIVSMALQFRHLSPSSVPSYTLPTTPVNGYGELGDVLLPESSLDHQVISEFLNPASPAGKSATPTSTTTATMSPSKVTLSVQNGSGVAGQAGQASTGLKALGFTVSGISNAVTFSHTTSVVEYRAGHEADAKAVAARVDGAVITEQVSTLADGNVVLVTGQSFGGIKGATSSATGTSGSASGEAAPGAGSTSSSAVNPNQPASFDPTPCPS
jgi:hypothetical protein